MCSGVGKPNLNRLVSWLNSSLSMSGRAYLMEESTRVIFFFFLPQKGTKNETIIMVAITQPMPTANWTF